MAISILLKVGKAISLILSFSDGSKFQKPWQLTAVISDSPEQNISNREPADSARRATVLEGLSSV